MYLCSKVAWNLSTWISYAQCPYPLFNALVNSCQHVAAVVRLECSNNTLIVGLHERCGIWWQWDQHSRVKRCLSSLNGVAPSIVDQHGVFMQPVVKPSHQLSKQIT